MKKIKLLSIIGLYLTFSLSSSIVFAEEITENKAESGLFTPGIEFNVTGYNEIIEPSLSKEINFKVKFKLNLGSLAKRFFFNRRIGRAIMFGFAYSFKFLNKLPKANLTLSVETPFGCKAELDKEEVTLEYNNEFEEADVKLTITLDEDVTALQNMDVKLEAKYLGQGNLRAFSNNTTISFMPGYVSNLSVDTESELTIPPLKEITVPINITNYGNGESSIRISIKNFDQKNWNITFDQNNIKIGVGKTELINMYVKPPNKFDIVPLTLTFVPISTVEDVDESYRQGVSIDTSITFYKSSSLEEDEGLDLTIALIIAFVILLIIVLITYIFKKLR